MPGGGLLTSLQMDRLESDVITRSVPMSVCQRSCKGRMPMPSDSAAEGRVDPRAIIHSVAISACENGHQWTQAVALLTLFGRNRPCPTPSH